MRKTMNISMPDDLYSFVQARVEAGCYGSASEYIRSLLRQDRAERIERKAPPSVSGPRRANDYLHVGSVPSGRLSAEHRNCPLCPDLVS